MQSNLRKNNQIGRFPLGLIFILLLLIGSNSAQASPAVEVQQGYLTGADNNKIFHRIVGNNQKSIIFVHGGPGFDLTDGGYELDPLAQNYRLIAYDQRGGGYSQPIEDRSKLSVEHHLADLEAIRKHFKLDKFTLIGLSWGSGLAMLYAAKYPQHIERVIMLAPMPIRKAMIDYRLLHTKSPTDNKALKALIHTDLSDASDEEVIAHCRTYIPLLFKPYLSPWSDWNNMKGDFCNTSIEGLKRRWQLYENTLAALGQFDWRTTVADYHGPVYIMEGRLSKVPLNTTREWAAYLPNAKLDLLENTGHMVWMDQQKVFFNNINTFLAGQWPKSAKAINPTHLDLLARYSFSNDLKNDMDNRFNAQGDKLSFGTDRHGNANSSATFAEGDKPITVVAPEWAAEPKNWTWSGWFKVSRQLDSKRTLLAQGDTVKLSLAAARPSLTVGDLKITDPTAVTAKQWFHVGVVQDGNSVKLFRDGRLVASANGDNLPPLTGDLTMHNRLGNIDDVRIYTGSLSDSQMRAVYDQ